MSGTLPSWMERWFGPANGPGMGVAWRLDYYWPWPTWATLLGVIVLAAAIVSIYLREGGLASRRYRIALAAIRLSAVAIVLAMIAQVELFLQRTGLPLVVVIIDDTQSMNTVDSYDNDRKSLEDRVRKAYAQGGGETRGQDRRVVRAAAAASAAPPALPLERGSHALCRERRALLAALSDSHKLRFYYLSDRKEAAARTRRASPRSSRGAEAKGESTRLGAAIRGVLDEFRGTAPVALVLATDGINTNGPGLLDGAGYARRRGVPLLFIGLGSDRPARSLKLSDLEVEDVVFVNDLVHFRFKLTAPGFAGKKVSIVLRETRSGEAEDKGESVGRLDVTVATDGRPQEVAMPYRPTRTGQFRYTVEVQPPPGGDRESMALRAAPGPFHPRPCGKDPRVARRRLAPLGVSFPSQPAEPRQDDPAHHVPAGRRPRSGPIEPARRQPGEDHRAEDLSRPPRRPDGLRRGDLRRRQSFLAEPRGPAEPGRFCRSAGQRRGPGADCRAELHAAGLPRHAAGAAHAVRSGQRPQSAARRAAY